MPNVTQEFKLYPRGFFGATLKPRVEKRAALTENNFGFQALMQKSVKKATDLNDINPGVAHLYSQYIMRSGETTSFEFRKMVLQVALTAFGTQRFDVWFLQQHRSPVAGDLHQKFLDDTLHFIQEGKRDMALENWNALLTITDGGGIPSELSKYAKGFFGITSDGVNRYSQNCQLTEVIQSWCSRPNGIEDLLGTMHVLFGNV